MRRRLGVFIATLSFTLGLLVVAEARAQASTYRDCTVDVASGSFGGTQGATSTGDCSIVSNGEDDPGQSTGPPTETVACGRPGVGSVGSWDSRCGAPLSCYDVDPTTHQRVQLDAYATFIVVAGVSVLQNVWCPTLAAPMPSAQALREQALRLLPSVQIGSAWTQRALVNAQSILWADTTTHRALATVTVVGRRVALRIDFDHARWDFGDQHTNTTSTPGTPYDDDRDPCATAQCPHYYGHTYTTTGAVTITLTVSWHAHFSLDNGATWTDIDPAPLTGPATTEHLTVIQARGILTH